MPMSILLCKLRQVFIKNSWGLDKHLKLCYTTNIIPRRAIYWPPPSCDSGGFYIMAIRTTFLCGWGATGLMWCSVATIGHYKPQASLQSSLSVPTCMLYYICIPYCLGDRVEVIPRGGLIYLGLMCIYTG